MNGRKHSAFGPQTGALHLHSAPRIIAPLAVWGLNGNAGLPQHMCAEAAQHFNLDYGNALLTFQAIAHDLSKYF